MEKFSRFIVSKTPYYDSAKKIYLILKRIIPKAIKIAYKYSVRDSVIHSVNRIRYRGFRFTCPCCNGNYSTFFPYGWGPNFRLNAVCPGCESLERQRLIWLYLNHKTNIFSGKLKLLHIGPELVFWKKFVKTKTLKCVSIDLEREFATYKMDITDLKFKDNTFDVIICIHVLQFIEDDIRAMREMYRVLKLGGWGIIQTYLDSSRSKTFEDPKAKTLEERKKAYGFATMTRIYGKDYGDRLGQAGFQVSANQYLKTFSETDIKKYGLTVNYGQLNDEDIYICVKKH